MNEAPPTAPKRDQALMWALYAMPVIFMAYMMASDLSNRGRLNNIEQRQNLMGARIAQHTNALQDEERRIASLEH